METFIYIFLGIVFFALYFSFAAFVIDKFKKSTGFDSFFWLIILLMTLSFLFSRSETHSSQSHLQDGGGSGEEDDFSFFNDCQDSSYDYNDSFSSCDWDDD
jgi:hypothetical protein